MLLKQFLRFAGVGVIGTAGHFAILIAVVEVLHGDPLVGSTLGFLGGALINYSLNRRFTFDSDASHGVALPRFLIVAAIGMGINTAIMAMLTKPLDTQYLVAQVVATALVLVWNFFANRFWTFADSGRDVV
jgi:putative flippase GtrA